MYAVPLSVYAADECVQRRALRRLKIRCTPQVRRERGAGHAGATCGSARFNSDALHLPLVSLTCDTHQHIAAAATAATAAVGGTIPSSVVAPDVAPIRTALDSHPRALQHPPPPLPLPPPPPPPH